MNSNDDAANKFAIKARLTLEWNVTKACFIGEYLDELELDRLSNDKSFVTIFGLKEIEINFSNIKNQV